MSGARSDHVFEYLKLSFNGTTGFIKPDGTYKVTPFKLSQVTQQISNWGDIAGNLPPGWDHDEYRIDGEPYAWCEILSENCDCHGSRGGLGIVCCSDFGLHEDVEKRASKSENVRHLYNTKVLEALITESDLKRENERITQRTNAPSRPKTPTFPIPFDVAASDTSDGWLREACAFVNPLVTRGNYCSIHKRLHSYDDHVVVECLSHTRSWLKQLSAMGEAKPGPARMTAIANHWLQTSQSRHCATQLLWGDADLPEILYKYIPPHLIGNGAPESLRATQLLALNDTMECNVSTMAESNCTDTLAYLRLVQTKLKMHLGLDVPWYDLLSEYRSHGSLRLSAFIQQCLNDKVGVVSLSSNPYVPTMWAHYALNTGILVGYDAKILRTLGYELRRMVYSEIAPVYQPSRDDMIRLDVVDHEAVDRELREGREQEGIPIKTSLHLAEFNSDWKSLSRLLLVKGISWEYEDEVRLLVELEKARDTGEPDKYGRPVKVIDLPPESILEIWRGEKTKDSVVEHAIEMGRGENRKGLLVQQVSSHAYRIQRSIGIQH